MTVIIEIVEKDKPKLEIPKFVCDDGINPNLENYPMLSNLNCYNFSIFCGKPRSGKTSLMIALLSGKGKDKLLRKAYNHVYLIMPASSRASLKKDIFKKHPDDKKFDELTFNVLDTIYNNLLQNTQEKEKSLLIMDDVAASLKNGDIQKLLRKIIFNRRHLKCSIIMLIQSYIAVPREVRKLVNNLFLWKCTKIEFETIANELFELKKDTALQLMKLYKHPHDFMMFCTDNRKIFINFDEVIIKDDDDDDLDEFLEK